MIEFLLNAPAYVKVGVSFAGILLTNRLGASLGLAILLFSVVLSLWSGTGIPGLVFQVQSFGMPENYLLPVVILLLLFFTESLNKAGRMERTVAALKSWLNNKKMLLAGLPALVGLLPMPGGAIFSAPLVASIDGSGELDARQKVAINYWFRHIWEYWWPLYPGVILAIRYSELPTAIFLLIQIPFTIAAAIGGYFFILKKVKRENFRNSEEWEAGTCRLSFRPRSDSHSRFHIGSGIGGSTQNRINRRIVEPSVHAHRFDHRHRGGFLREIRLHGYPRWACLKKQAHGRW